MTQYPKRLIEVDLPIKRISAHARREKSIRHGHISTLHIWWARRPLAACRAVICASLWPDPADANCPQAFREAALQQMLAFSKATQSNKDLAAICDAESWKRYKLLGEGKPIDFGKPKDLEQLRSYLLDFIADAASWEASTSQPFLDTARSLTQSAHEALGGENGTRPLVVDPFAGGGAIPLEALRVGADAFASDLNPIPVLLNRVMLELLPTAKPSLPELMATVAARIAQRAKDELGQFYADKPGESSLAYLWARTVISEAPGEGPEPVEIPLISSMWLSKKPKRGRAFRWKRNEDGKVRTQRVTVRYSDGTVKAVRRPLLEVFEPKSASNVEGGTVTRGAATCPVSGFTMLASNVRSQLSARHGGASDARLLGVVRILSGERGRHYCAATEGDAALAIEAGKARNKKKAFSDEIPFLPDEATPLRSSHRAVASLSLYGIDTFGDLYTPRQSLALGTLIELVRDEVQLLRNDQSPEVCRAVQILLSMAVSKLADYCSTLASWSSPASQETVRSTFGRQTLSMIWDFAESNIFASSSGGWDHMLGYFGRTVAYIIRSVEHSGVVALSNANALPLPDDTAACVVTDPPYYDSIPYAELSDYFYVWLKRGLWDVERDLFTKRETPKTEQAIVWHPSSKDERKDYESKMRASMEEARRVVVDHGIAVVVFAHKSTAGWETQLQSMVDAGWTITASWPIDTERAGRTNANNTASLASSVHLVCRPRLNGERRIGDWRDVLAELPKRIGEWMKRLSSEGVVGADAIFACLGPALEVFSRYTHVEKASGEAVSLSEYLTYVWGAVAQEALTQIFQGADATGFEEDARLTAMWLWTLNAGGIVQTAVAETLSDAEEEDSADGAEADDADDEGSKSKGGGYVLEFDAARKIAQGLGAHLEQMSDVIEMKGDKARLLSVGERTRKLFGKDEAEAPKAKGKKKTKQMSLGFMQEIEAAEAEGGWGDKSVPKLGETVLDRIHQSMILFAAGRGEAVRRFLVEDGAGQDQRFWKLANALSALYPQGTDEKRWVDGVLARKKGLGL